MQVENKDLYSLIKTAPALVAAAMDHFDSVWAGFRCKDCGRKEYCGDPIVK